MSTVSRISRWSNRKSKPSPHTERAARADFTAIHAHLREVLGPGVVMLDEVTPRALRLAFPAFAAGHLAASIARAWSTWNQFYALLVAEDNVAGNPWEPWPDPRLRGGRRSRCRARTA